MTTAADRYAAAAHAVQSGVATEIGMDGTETGPASPKHLRVGINTAHADIASIAALLIAKGIITEAEHVEALADGMENEKARYEQHLSERLGKPVTLV